MFMIVSNLNTTNIWFYFGLLQVLLVLAYKRNLLTRELMIPKEIVLIGAATLFVLETIPTITFFTVIATLAALCTTHYVTTFLDGQVVVHHKQ